MAKKPKAPLAVETLKHDEAKRKNIPTAEYQSVMQKDEQSPVRIAYERRNRDLDPQLVWRGKDEQDWSDLVVHAPPLYIQEKVHPKVLIDDLLRQSSRSSPSGRGAGDEGAFVQIDLFADFNGIPEEADKTDFYQHDGKWQNRMILGDSLQAMASLAEREGLRGKAQDINVAQLRFLAALGGARPNSLFFAGDLGSVDIYRSQISVPTKDSILK